METMTPAYAVFYAVGIVVSPLAAYIINRKLGISPGTSLVGAAIAAFAFAVLA